MYGKTYGGVGGGELVGGGGRESNARKKEREGQGVTREEKGAR